MSDFQADAQPAVAPVVGEPAIASTPSEPSLNEIMLEQANRLLADDGDKTKPADPKTNPDNDKAARGHDGKFAKKNDGAAGKSTGELKDVKPEDKKDTPVVPSRPVPQHWAAPSALKEKWSTLPTEVQEAVSTLAAKDRQTISRLGNEIKAFQPYQQVEQKYAGYFKQVGMTPAQVLANNVEWNRLLLTDPERALPALAERIGFDLSRLVPQAQAGQDEVPIDPTVAALRTQNKQLADRLARIEGQQRGIASHLTERERVEAERRADSERAQIQTIRSSIDEFAAKNADFADVEDDVLDLIPILRGKGVPEGELLQTAYERAVMMNPATRDKRINERAEAIAKSRIEPAKRAGQDARTAAAVNVRGSQKNDAIPLTVEQAQAEVLRKHGLIN